MTTDGRRTGATRVRTPDPEVGESGADRTPNPGEDPYDRRIFFSAEAAPDPSGGPLAVECARCHTTTTVSPAAWLRAHAPLFLWVPTMRYSRWARCPSCRRRSWVRLTLAR